MSLILEALRKSEADRRRGETPNVHVELSPSRETRPHAMPMWAWWMIAAVMGAAGWWWLHTRTTLAMTDGTVPAATTTIAMHQKTESDALPPVRHLTPSPAPATTSTPTATPVPAAPPPPYDLTIAPHTSAPAAIAPSAPAAAANSNVLRLSDLSIEERRGLPPLKLSMHMWNDDPTQRFVILDGNRLHEGDRIGQAIVTTITTDSVILDWNGQRLSLPIR